MQQKLPFSIGFHTLLFLFTGCALPVLCISSVCLSRLLFSCPQARNYSVLKGCMAPCLPLSLTLPSIDKAARWITAYLTESSKSPASIAQSNKQWVGTCLIRLWASSEADCEYPLDCRKQSGKLDVKWLFRYGEAACMLISRGINIKYSANIVLIISKLLIVKSIICYKNQKHFNQFTMSLLFCVIMYCQIFCLCICAYQSS